MKIRNTYNICRLIILMFVTALSGCKDRTQKHTKKPNFIILQADDLGYDDLPVNGNIYVQTPHIDGLSRRSIISDNFYVNPVCAPSRASLLTGRDFLLTGVSHVHGGKDYMSLTETTLADIFRNEGYTTGLWGKWHSGKSEGYFPWQRGFDEAYMAALYKHQNSSGLFNGSPVTFDKWADEVVVDYAVEFIRRNKEKPFLAYLSFLTCHAPIVAKDEIIEKYIRKGLSKNLAAVYAMIDQMDTEIGRLLVEINELGIADNTVIIFMSDNGPAIINNWLNNTERKIRYHNHYKGHKGNIWENGVKSPLLISYPNQFQPREAHFLCDVTDILPTMADIADINLEKYNLKLTGSSFAQNLYNNEDSRPEKIIFNYADRGWPPSDAAWTAKGIKDEYLPIPEKDSNKYLAFENQIISLQNEQFKLLKNASSRENNINNAEGYALVNMKADPKENKNTFKEYPEIYDKMKSQLFDKYQSVIRAKNSFKPIVFQLVKGKEKTIELFAPSKLSAGLSIAYAFSYPWNKSGLWAEYVINVRDPMTLTPTIRVNKISDNVKFKFEVGETSSYSLKTINNKIIFEPVYFTPGEHTIRISTVPGKLGSEEIQFKTMILEESEFSEATGKPN